METKMKKMKLPQKLIEYAKDKFNISSEEELIVMALENLISKGNKADSAFSGNVIGNGKIVDKPIEIGDYNSINSNSCADIVYTQETDKKPRLVISTDENLLQYINVSVKNKQLIITCKNNISLNFTKLLIVTSSKNISNIKTSGSGDIYLQNKIKTKAMKISMSGSGDAAVENLECRDFEFTMGGSGDSSIKNISVNTILTINGSGDINIKGQAQSALFEIKGSGDISAFDYKVTNLVCRISGSGDAELNASKLLKASILGSGDITYKGNPHIESSILGSGNIDRF
jgi:hypothetical protein